MGASPHKKATPVKDKSVAFTTVNILLAAPSILRDLEVVEVKKGREVRRARRPLTIVVKRHHQSSD